VAVVAEGDAGVAHVAVAGLGIAPRAGPGGGVADVADGQVSLEGCQLALVEGVGHQAHVLDHGDGVAVAAGHARRFLAPGLAAVGGLGRTGGAATGGGAGGGGGVAGGGGVGGALAGGVVPAATVPAGPPWAIAPGSAPADDEAAVAGAGVAVAPPPAALGSAT